jgi:hypothetical protein
MTKITKYIMLALLTLVVVGDALAVCPVCTVAVGAGLEGARLLGVEDVITGIWAGGLTLSIAAWTANWLRRMGIKNVLVYLVNYVAYYVLLAGVYFVPIGNPIVKFNENCMWGIDQFLLGAIVGTAVFFGMQKWYQRIKAANGGHAKYPFQKVVMPFTGLLIVTVIFWAIIRWLPMIGITLC